MAIGLVGASLLTRAMDSILFGVEALNEANFVAMAVVMWGGGEGKLSSGPTLVSSGSDGVAAGGTTRGTSRRARSYRPGVAKPHGSKLVDPDVVHWVRSR